MDMQHTEASVHSTQWQMQRPCGGDLAQSPLERPALRPEGWHRAPGGLPPRYCRAAEEGTGHQAAALCLANSWLLSDEVEREEAQ